MQRGLFTVSHGDINGNKVNGTGTVEASNTQCRAAFYNISIILINIFPFYDAFMCHFSLYFPLFEALFVKYYFVCI